MSAAAEAFAVAVQKEAVQQLPADKRDRVTVAALSHTNERALLYNWPTSTTLPGTLLQALSLSQSDRQSGRQAVRLCHPLGPAHHASGPVILSVCQSVCQFVRESGRQPVS